MENIIRNWLVGNLIMRNRLTEGFTNQIEIAEAFANHIAFDGSFAKIIYQPNNNPYDKLTITYQILCQLHNDRCSNISNIIIFNGMGTKTKRKKCFGSQRSLLNRSCMD